MIQLSHKQIYPPVVAVDFVKPLSYEFRVIEHLNSQGKIERAGLQVQIWEHDEFGNGIVKQAWHDVPRFQMDHNGDMMSIF